MTAQTMPFGDVMLGRMVDAAGQPIDSGEPLGARDLLTLDMPAYERRPLEQLVTGVKAIDLYAPLARGGLNVISAVAGVGKIVVTSELILQLGQRRQFRAIIALAPDPVFGQVEHLNALREGGSDIYTAFIAADNEATPADLRTITLTALAGARHWAEQGHEVLLIMDARLLDAETDSLFETRSWPQQVTVLLWNFTGPELPAAPPIVQRIIAQSDAHLVLSRNLGKRGIWPAIDPLASRSALLEQELLGSEHGQAIAAARQLLRNHAQLTSDVAPKATTAAERRAERLLLFCSQPFSVAEHITARPGVQVEPEQALAGVQAILRGDYDDVDGETLRFSGAL